MRSYGTLTSYSIFSTHDVFLWNTNNVSWWGYSDFRDLLLLYSNHLRIYRSGLYPKLECQNKQIFFLMLHRYWLVVYPEDRYGSKNIGVTATNSHQAKSIIKEQLLKLGWIHITTDSIDNAEMIEDIDICLLDQNHVIPNRGVVTTQGVWYPNLSYSV